MNWTELGQGLALGPVDGWPTPLAFQGLSPSQIEVLREVLKALLATPRSSSGLGTGLRWSGEGWIWRESEQEKDGRWTPADPSREASQLLMAARELLWRGSSEPLELLAALEALLATPLGLRCEAHQAELARLETPAQVVNERWLIASSALPPELLEEACGPAQRTLWEAEGEGVVDTATQPEGLVPALIKAAAPARRGLILVGDNALALRLLQGPWGESIQCAYLDPPYNTGSGSFAYADRRPRDAWLSFMDERLRLVGSLLRPDGTLYAQIDQHEGARLRLLLDRHLKFVSEIVWRIGWVSGFKTRAKRFIRNHDTIYQYGRVPKPLFNKRYLPYPDGYRRRDGKLPTGKGIPLEDTWNCSAGDRLDSVQIVSFSKEKVGRGNLTQKSEALLARMLQASSDEDDWVLDPFLGSGTTPAVALKLGRRFVGIERDPALVAEVIAPRLRRVISGDPYGISKRVGWVGGGVVQVLTLGAVGAAAPTHGWEGPRGRQ